MRLMPLVSTRYNSRWIVPITCFARRCFTWLHARRLRLGGILDACRFSARDQPAAGRVPVGVSARHRARPHHLIERNGNAVERRLRQTTLYRPDLDLVVLDRKDHVVGYGLFWFDPVTSTWAG